MKLEIAVQDPPKSIERENDTPKASGIEEKNLMDVIEYEDDTSFTRARNNLHGALVEL